MGYRAVQPLLARVEPVRRSLRPNKIRPPPFGTSSAARSCSSSAAAKTTAELLGAGEHPLAARSLFKTLGGDLIFSMFLRHVFLKPSPRRFGSQGIPPRNRTKNRPRDSPRDFEGFAPAEKPIIAYGQLFSTSVTSSPPGASKSVWDIMPTPNSPENGSWHLSTMLGQPVHSPSASLPSNHILRRWLDPQNPPQPPSQEAVGALGRSKTKALEQFAKSTHQTWNPQEPEERPTSKAMKKDEIGRGRME